MLRPDSAAICLARRAARVALPAVVMLISSVAPYAAERPSGARGPAECVPCHERLRPGLVGDWQASGHGRAQVGCTDCHGAIHDGGARARVDKTCIDCHGGASSPEVQSYATSKHGILVRLEAGDRDRTLPSRGGNYRAPGCAYCHFHAAGHDSRRLVAQDGVGSSGAEDGRARDAAKAVCYDCHAPRYIARHSETGERMLEIARMKWREAQRLLQAARAHYSEAELASAEPLLERMRTHVRNVNLGIAHQSPDYQWWHGQPALDGDLLRIKGDLDRLRREVERRVGDSGPAVDDRGRR
jgi:hypothetical protein